MITTKRVVTLAALIGFAGVGVVEMTDNIAQAAEATTMRIAAYSAARIDTAFDLVANMPARAPFMLPMAQKGDLLAPPGCAGMNADAQAECMDVAYELPAEQSIVVETREGTVTTLMRMDAISVAGIPSALPELPQSRD